ncbi:MAG: leucine-rich repeat domain-containing protein [Oscillospiraceae bacterium]|nr:leucine-rich repeat domain-containing protein [Oscillospiraceae bacterium]
MKKALKIAVPILLIIAILCSIVWYLLKYDPQLTRDILVDQARRAGENGDHSLSTWLYELAYQQSGNDEDVAIELAQQFVEVGNYTKAESTLSHAIADGGSVDLYIALCQTYVVQDKLLDAVTMLDNVSDPTIRAQLDAKRPTAPTVSPEPGYFSQYITVTLDAPAGTIYATTDGEYPSTSQAHYTDPIQLSGGETTVKALVVSDEGLVSPLITLGYTVAGVIEEVTLTDPAIDQAVRQALQVSDDHVLYTNELWAITTLAIPSDAQSLEDLRYLPFLQQLIIRDHDGFEELSSLSSLTELHDLIIVDMPVRSSDLQYIAALPKLTTLTLSGTSLSGIDPLSAATKLTRLDLSDNTIRDLTALSYISELSYLDLSHNAIDTLEHLSGMTKLTELYASYNAISTTAPISSCTSLMVLDLNENDLTTIAGLESIPGLRTVYLSNNLLTEVTTLSTCTTIGDLDISDNAITDIQALSSLTGLMILDLSHNQVTQLPAFTKDHSLVSIDGSYNLITSLDPLKGLPSLNYVDMEQNSGITSVTPLAACPLLVEVNVYGTGVTDVSELTDNDRNVIVKYSPI